MLWIFSACTPMRSWASSLIETRSSGESSGFASMSAKMLSEVFEGESLRILRGKELPPHFHEVGVVSFFVDGEVELFLEREEFLFLRVLVEGEFGFLHQAAVLRLLHETHEIAIARLAELDFEKQAPGSVDVAGVGEFLRLGGEVVAEGGLLFDELIDEWPVFVELVGRLGGGPEMMSGVRASSMRIESTSSMMAR